MENVILIIVGILSLILLPLDILFLAALIATEHARRVQEEEEFKSYLPKYDKRRKKK